MRVVGLHRDVLVATSRVWQTTCTIVRNGDGVLRHRLAGPARRARDPARGARAGGLRRSRGLLATHADWDHLLGRLAFAGRPRSASPRRPPRASPPSRAPPRASCARSTTSSTSTARRRCRSARCRRCRCPATARSATPSSSCTRPTATPPTGWRSGSGWARVLVCGDYLSPVEIPWISEGGSRDAYLATLRRLEPLVERGRARRAGPRRGARRRARRGDPARGRRLPRGAARRRAADRPPLAGAARDPCRNRTRA